MVYKEPIQASELDRCMKSLIEEMRRKQYAESQIEAYNRIWKKLLKYTANHKSEPFNEDFRQRFLSEEYGPEMESRDSMYVITRAINMLSDYVYFRVIFRQYCTPKTTFSEEYKEAFQSFIDNEKMRNLSELSMKSLFVRLIRFHDYLVDSGIQNLKQLTPEIIRLYVLSLARYSTTYTSETLRILRRFMEYIYENRFCPVLYADCIPHVKNLRQQKLPTIFTTEEIQKILDVVDRSNPIGKRDYAIILLATRTGLRSSDIRKLSYENIDWDSKTINLIQQKTKKSLSLPLTDDVGWAIIDYLKNGRPKTAVQNIFVSHNSPYGELSSLGNTVPRYMRRAGMKSPENKRIGMHSFRHSLATRMLENDISLPIVSQTLGHADIHSTEVYLRISIKQLAKCGLEVDL